MKLHFVILSNSRITECFFIDEEAYEWVKSPPNTPPPLKIQTKFNHISLKRNEPSDITLLQPDRLSDLFIIADPPIFYDEYEAVKHIENNNIEIISQVSSIIF